MVFSEKTQVLRTCSIRCSIFDLCLVSIQIAKKSPVPWGDNSQWNSFLFIFEYHNSKNKESGNRWASSEESGFVAWHFLNHMPSFPHTRSLSSIMLKIWRIDQIETDFFSKKFSFRKRRRERAVQRAFFLFSLLEKRNLNFCFKSFYRCVFFKKFLFVEGISWKKSKKLLRKIFSNSKIKNLVILLNPGWKKSLFMVWSFIFKTIQFATYLITVFAFFFYKLLTFHVLVQPSLESCQQGRGNTIFQYTWKKQISIFFFSISVW